MYRAPRPAPVSAATLLASSSPRFRWRPVFEIDQAPPQQWGPDDTQRDADPCDRLTGVGVSVASSDCARLREGGGRARSDTAGTNQRSNVRDSYAPPSASELSRTSGRRACGRICANAHRIFRQANSSITPTLRFGTGRAPRGSIRPASDGPAAGRRNDVAADGATYGSAPPVRRVYCISGHAPAGFPHCRRLERGDEDRTWMD